MPPAKHPAAAPAKAGRVGAPWRSARRKIASGPMPISGIKVRQTMLLVPINLAAHTSGGRTSSTTTRQRKEHRRGREIGHAVRQARPAATARGRGRRRSTASVIVTTN